MRSSKFARFIYWIKQYHLLIGWRKSSRRFLKSFKDIYKFKDCNFSCRYKVNQSSLGTFTIVIIFSFVPFENKKYLWFYWSFKILATKINGNTYLGPIRQSTISWRMANLHNCSPAFESLTFTLTDRKKWNLPTPKIQSSSLPVNFGIGTFIFGFCLQILTRVDLALWMRGGRLRSHSLHASTHLPARLCPSVRQYESVGPIGILFYHSTIRYAIVPHLDCL